VQPGRVVRSLAAFVILLLAVGYASWRFTLSSITAHLDSQVPKATAELRSWKELRDRLLARPYSGQRAGDAGMFLHQRGDVSAALLCYNWAHRMDPTNVRWLYYASELQLRNRSDFVSARKFLGECVRSHPADTTVLAKYAFVLSRLGENAEALAAYQDLIHKDPLRAASHTEYAVLLRRAGRREEAIREFKMALALTQDEQANVTLFSMLPEGARGIAYAERHSAATPSPYDADPYLDELYWRFPSAAYLGSRFNQEFALGRVAAGLRLLRYARACFPNRTDLLLDSVYFETLYHGKEETVRGVLQSQLEPSTMSKALYTYGLALVQIGSRVPACEAYRRSLEQNPAYPEALNEVGLCAEHNGHRSEAVKFYRTALLHGTYQPAAENLKRLTGESR